METIIATVALLGMLVAAMAVGVIFRGKALKGSCGGVGSEDCYCFNEGTPNACENPPPNGPQANPDGVIVYGGSPNV